jgi:hypothetical protein
MRQRNKKSTDTINTNCLEGLRCPNCRSSGPLYIEVNTTALVFDNGVEETQDHEWTPESACRCSCCGYSETIASFDAKKGGAA